MKLVRGFTVGFAEVKSEEGRVKNLLPPTTLLTILAIPFVRHIAFITSTAYHILAAVDYYHIKACAADVLYCSRLSRRFARTKTSDNHSGHDSRYDINPKLRVFHT